MPIYQILFQLYQRSLIKNPKNGLLQTFSLDFTWNRQIWLFYAEKWIFSKSLVLCLTCLNTDVPACRCHCSNIFAMAEEISKINNFSILKKLKTCTPCDYLLYRKSSTTLATPVVDTLGAKNVLRDACLGESAEKKKWSGVCPLTEGLL